MHAVSRVLSSVNTMCYHLTSSHSCVCLARCLILGPERRGPWLCFILAPRHWLPYPSSSMLHLFFPSAIPSCSTFMESLDPFFLIVILIFQRKVSLANVISHVLRHECRGRRSDLRREASLAFISDRKFRRISFETFYAWLDANLLLVSRF